MTLTHTHDSGQPCLACDLDYVRWNVDCDALDRIEAVLADVEHLERAAQLLSESPPGENFLDYQAHCEEWRKAERARKERSGAT